jgi:hypothetical protein
VEAAPGCLLLTSLSNSNRSLAISTRTSEPTPVLPTRKDKKKCAQTERLKRGIEEWRDVVSKKNKWARHYDGETHCSGEGNKR